MTRRVLAVTAYAVALFLWCWLAGIPNDPIGVALWLWLLAIIRMRAMIIRNQKKEKVF